MFWRTHRFFRCFLIQGIKCLWYDLIDAIAINNTICKIDPLLSLEMCYSDFKTSCIIHKMVIQQRKAGGRH